jgi:hypothetical protein
LEEKLMKIKKDLNVHSIIKMLKSKINVEDAKVQFENIEVTLVGLSQIIDNFKNEFDSHKYHNTPHPTNLNRSKQSKMMDVIRLIQKSYKNSLASSKVLNCLSCGRGDANFEKLPRYVKAKDNAFFINRIPVTRSKQAKFKKPRGQSAYVVNKRLMSMGQSVNAKVSKGWRLNENVKGRENRRPQTSIPKIKQVEEVEVDYGMIIIVMVYVIFMGVCLRFRY